MVAGPDQVFRALADGTRREVLRALVEHGETTATALARTLPVTRQAIAKHLATLEEAGLIATRREGRETRVVFTPEPLDDAVAWIDDVAARWDQRLARLRARAERRRTAPRAPDAPES